MSEASAAVCVEARSDGPGLFIDGSAMVSDAFHITGIDPAGGALRHLLKKLDPHIPVDLVHAHGTATDSNDPVELAAIDDVFGPSTPAIYSHKAALGHTQGAAGMIGVVLDVLMHRQQIVLPNPHTTSPLASAHLTIPIKPLPRSIRRSIALAAGFGGAIAGVAISEA
jgi:3-oxoacyl-[acyl-carrier-protein] synthase II